VNVDELGVAVLGGSLVLLLAVGAVRLSTRTGTPSLLLYLGLGIALGESGLGIAFEDFELTTVLGYAALAVILAEGGLTTRWTTIRSSVLPAGVLATVGTAVSVVVVAVAAHLLLGVEWVQAFLLGAVVASTDAAAVFSVLRVVPLPRRLAGMLEAESGFNDAPVVILVVALSAAADGADLHSPLLVVLAAGAELAGGAAIGLGLGWLGARVLRSVALPSSGLYPIAVMSFCALAYGGATVLHASGFLAVYLAALVLGNADLPHRPAVRGFAEGLGWIAQIGLFVLLGLLVSPSELLDQVVPALAIGTVLLLLARPLSVVASVSWLGYSWRDQAFLSWAGLRGAVPIVLATIPVQLSAPGTEGLFELVFVLVVVFTLVQAPTLPRVARRLRLAADTPQDLEVESSPLGAIDAQVLTVGVGPGSRLHGMEMFELRLPEGAGVSLVVRDGASFVPQPGTRLRRGDQLMVICPGQVRRLTERRLHVLSKEGRLAQWRGGAPAARSTRPRRPRAPWTRAPGPEPEQRPPRRR
jgi:cell volume regulation protein A